MRYLRPIPRRLLPDDMMVWPALGDGSFGEVILVRHVRFERAESVVDDAHRSADGGAGTVVVEAVNSEGTFEIPAGLRVLVGAGPIVLVRSCRRCCVIRGVVHRWEVGQGKPEIDNVVKLAQIYRVSVDYVLTGEQHVPSVSEVETRPARRELPREYRVAVSIVLVFMGLAAAFALFILLVGFVYTLFWGLPGAA